MKVSEGKRALWAAMARSSSVEEGDGESVGRCLCGSEQGWLEGG